MPPANDAIAGNRGWVQSSEGAGGAARRIWHAVRWRPFRSRQVRACLLENLPRLRVKGVYSKPRKGDLDALWRQPRAMMDGVGYGRCSSVEWRAMSQDQPPALHSASQRGEREKATPIGYAAMADAVGLETPLPSTSSAWTRGEPQSQKAAGTDAKVRSLTL